MTQTFTNCLGRISMEKEFLIHCVDSLAEPPKDDAKDASKDKETAVAKGAKKSAKKNV